MIFRIGITLLFFVLVSCTSSDPKEELNPYYTCLPETFRNDLLLLVKSFDEYVNNNYDGDKSKFLSSIIDRKPLEQAQFMESDYQVVDNLRVHNFKSYFISDNATNLDLIEMDAQKVYLKCFNDISTDGKLITSYVKLRNENPFLSQLALGRLFLYSKKDADYSTQLANTVIAVELYYNILNEKIK